MAKVIAPGVVRLGPLLDQYSESQKLKISCLSILVYILSAFTFIGTTYLYNPNNLFGDTLISSPVSTIIQSTYENGCTGLSAYAVSPGDFNREGFLDPPTVSLAADGAVQVSFMENASYVEETSDFFVRLSQDNGLPIFQETLPTGTNIRYNASFPFSSIIETGIQKLNVSLRIVPNTPVLLSGDPDECADFFAETALEDFDQNCFDVIDLESGFSLQGVPCTVSQANLSTSYQIVINIPMTPRYILDIQILDLKAVRTAMKEAFCGSTGPFNVLRVAPFACQVSSFRDWLEVLALSFANAGLVYALTVTLVFVLVHAGTSSCSEEKLYPSSEGMRLKVAG